MLSKVVDQLVLPTEKGFVKTEGYAKELVNWFVNIQVPTTALVGDTSLFEHDTINVRHKISAMKIFCINEV